MKELLSKPTILFYCIPFLFLLIYLRIFFADYAYLDEIHFLWHNTDNTNFIIFHSTGRGLAGLLYQKFFSSISTIGQLKLFRIFSLIGWMLTALLWTYLYKKWAELINLPKQIWWLGSLYAVCSVSVCIYIGWAACMQIFLGILAGLASGHILFINLYKQQKAVRLSNWIIVGALLLGVASLFFYQSSFGIFLIPFFLYYIQTKKAKPDRRVIIGVVFYLAVYLVYYFLFKYWLKVYHLEASNRTEIHLDFFRKLSFFFSGPLPSAFSMNLLFRPSGIFSQIFYVLVITIWLITTFKRNKHNSIATNILFMAMIFLLLGLIYLPSMIAEENFASYRTLFVFNLAVFIMVADSLLYLFKQEKYRRFFTIFMSLWLILTSFYTFNYQFINPLQKEYKVLRSFVQTNYKSGIRNVYFIRADKSLFRSTFHLNIYRDEFGVPSTYRDWVPEPIIKQMVFEITKNRKIAEEINVIQFENAELFNQSKPSLDSTTLVVNMNDLFHQ
ncbi:MAG TPA: hypothetical protein VGQ09_09125 [Chitinophagaceae bacterium]|jgi:hypothetical protein|nr:hypothetical protein [Chitinophagaceae bacterium]